MTEGAFTHDAIAAAIRSKAPTLFAAIREQVQDRLKKLSPSEALTFRLLDGENERRRVAPEASKEYASILIAFCRGQKYNGYPLDSAVTPVVMATVESTLLGFFASEAVGQAVSDAIQKQFAGVRPGQKTVAQELSDNADWAKKEVATLLNYGTVDSIAMQIINLGADQIHEFLASSVGKQLVLAVTKMMATSAGKTFLIKAMQMAIAKVMASVALKAAIISLLKKVGVGILIKTAVGKALIAVLAVVGLAHIPVFWVLIPLLLAFLAYEYNTFPKKLAAKLPQEVERIIRDQFDIVSDQAAREIFKGVLAELVKRMTNLNIPPTSSA
jgi:hypothetical protein